ncbi:MAG: carbamoyltransferase HypF [Actinomycetota bacterium]
MVGRKRRLIEIEGTVQGVGFRPFVVRWATELGLAGSVGNDGRRVHIEVEGPLDQLDRFTTALTDAAPPLAVVEAMTVADMAPTGQQGFVISTSEVADPGHVAVPPDVAPCSACLTEMDDPNDRRFRYPFICCTDCGPRYTVIRQLPYDRERTSMARFELCPACRREYEDPNDRRFHAQATCCPTCGPELDVSIESAIEQLRSGRIVAVKGLGGYQLLCRADRAESVRQLRHRKNREEKPLAVLVSSVDEAEALVELDPVARRALAGPEAPIVLATAKGGPDRGALAADVAPGTGLVGVMLPSTPLHRLLANGLRVPLVCTSGNRSEEPIVIDDETVQARLGPIADAFLGHDRSIERRADDSVGQVVGGRFQLLRRARGFAPRPVALLHDGPPVLGLGAELKSTVCLAVGRAAGLSVHLGDLESPATLQEFERAIADQQALTGTEPRLVVHDLHPEYLSTKFGRSQVLAPTLAVQHHHAHLAACLADNGLDGSAIGVTFDGLGWGADDTAWGGEFLVGDATAYTRAAHLRPVALPGGAAAARQPWRMAVAHLVGAYGAKDAADLAWSVPTLLGAIGPGASASDPGTALDAVVGLCQAGRSVPTSSMGRLFDAVAAFCGVGGVVSYEGQAAIGLEQIDAEGEADRTYPWEIGSGAAMVIDPAPLIRAIVDDLDHGVAATAIAARFHRSVASLIVEVCQRLREDNGLDVVALTGGVFQNRLLVELTVPPLETAGFTVLIHGQVTPNDGGISLGQVAIGRAHLRASQT